MSSSKLFIISSSNSSQSSSLLNKSSICTSRGHSNEMALFRVTICDLVLLSAVSILAGLEAERSTSEFPKLDASMSLISMVAFLTPGME
eukprot:CAMPEP_0183727768 /NCGR_PEP_ID=MMETSP0737-20130205/26361_1 /TAXON_ID=385413 /ORGANISM="Thalassiosira miniscula, Strain CCMP1093" /LENGTH=88 /DNA_ID=CAMNT_0025959489 /DNA_START=51 /DNA_END=317 /DNA_ORIENTATION=-